MYYNVNDITQYLTNFELDLDGCFYEDSVEDFVWKIDPGVDSYIYDSGISKCVIIPKKTEYVIKIPFTGYIEDADNDKYYDFDCFRGWNSCAFEMAIEQEAREEGFGQFFLPLTRVVEYTKYPVYIQPKAVSLQADTKKRYKKYPQVSEKIKNILKEKEIFLDTRMNKLWLEEIYEKINSEDDFLRFLDFLRDRELDGDLHCSNIGHWHDEPVLIDYAGFETSKEDYYD